MANDKEIIIFNSDNSSDSNSTSKEIVYSSPDIVSSKGPSKSLLKWNEDLTYEYKEKLWFSKSGGKKTKAKASGLSSSKDKVSPKTLIVKSPVPITNYALGLANAKTKDVIFDKTFGVKMPTVMTGAEEKKGEREIGGGS
ncbi:hypothetical protein Tco_0140550 [Tanacetum coccineum]